VSSPDDVIEVVIAENKKLQRVAGVEMEK